MKIRELITCLGAMIALASCAPAVVVRPEEPTVVVVPEAPTPNHIWVNGAWRWNRPAHNYSYSDGYWVQPKKRRATYVPGRWVQTRRGGWRYLQGHWR